MNKDNKELETFHRKLYNMKKDALAYIALGAIKKLTIAQQGLLKLYDEATCEECKQKVLEIINQMDEEV